MADYVTNLCSEKKCPVCGKTFFLPSWMVENYVYKLVFKDRYKYICSYTCYSKAIDERNKKKPRKEAIYK